MRNDLPQAKYKPDIKPVNQNTLNCLRHWDYLIKEDDKKLDKSETLILGYDSAHEADLAVLSVTRYDGSVATIVNVFHGEEAEWMYNRLINRND